MSAPRLPIRGLHLAALYTLVVSAPLFHELAHEPVFFTSRQTSPGGLLVFAVLVGIVAPYATWLIDELVGRTWPRGGRRLHFAGVALFALFGSAQIVAGLPSALAVVSALALGAGLTALYGRSALARRALTLLVPLPLVVTLLFVLDSRAATYVQGDRATPVVMVVFDELTGTSLLDAHNQVDPVLYPHFARLAHDGTYYRNFTAAADETTRVTAALMTGDLWKEDAKPTASDYPHNLFTLLGESYRMRVSEEASDFCPPAICERGPRDLGPLYAAAGLLFLHRVAPHAIDRHVTSRRDVLDGSYDPERAAAAVTDDSRIHKAPVVLHELGAGGRPARFRRWLRSISGNVGRTFYFKHVLLPHVPWQYLPDGRLYRHENEWIKGMSDPPAFGDRWFLIQDYQRHLVQLAFADRLLGELIARLKREGIYDKALIVVTADNGESFLHANHDRHIADPVTFTDIASAPLFIKRPFQKSGGYDDRHVRSIDVVPSMAEVLGIKPTWKLLGRSIFDPKMHIPGRIYVRREQFKKGNTFEISLAGYERSRRLALARKLAIFGQGLWRVGPRRELIGRPANARGDASGLRASVNAGLRPLLRRVLPHSEFVPAMVTGTLTGRGARPGVPLALALDGRVAAVGWSAQLKGDRRVWFSFLAQPSFLRAGANSLGLFRIGAGGALARIATSF